MAIDGVRRWRLCLLIMPAVILLAGVLVERLHGPSWLGANLDPEYAYLMTFVNILHRTPSGMMLHPGTTLNMYGSGIIWGGYRARLLAGATESLQRDVLGNAEVYLDYVCMALVSMAAISCLLSGILVLASGRKWSQALLIQSTPVFFAACLVALSKTVPENMLVSIGLLLAGWLCVMVCPDRLTSKPWHAGVLGLLIGFGVATKVTALSWLGLLWIVPSLAGLGVALGGVALAFCLGTLPIWPQYLDLAGWLGRSVTHAGKYDTGDVGVPALADMASNFVDALRAEPVFIVLACMLIGLSVVFVLKYLCGSKSDSHRAKMRVSLAFGTTVLLQLVLVTKQFEAHYLVPAMMLVPVGLLLLFSRRRPVVGANCFSNPRIVISLATIVVGLALLRLSAWARDVDVKLKASHEIDRIISEQYPDCQVISYYRASGRYALAFGAEWTQWLHAESLSEMYPSAIFYDMWRDRFYGYDGSHTRASIRARLRCGERILLRGSPFTPDRPYGQSLNVVRLDQGLVEALYLLTDVDELEEEEIPPLISPH